MGQQYVLSKRYVNFKGLDKKATDLTRSIEYASLIKNAQYRKSGAPEKRPGYEGYAGSIGGFGLFTYNRVNPSTGAVEPEELNVGATVYKRKNSTLSVSYSGPDSTALISIFLDTDTEVFRCQITEGSTLKLDQSLGIGIDEASPYTISNLVSQINLIPNFLASVSGDGSVAAAFLKTTRDHDLTSSGSALSVTASYWSAVNTPISNPLNGSSTHRNDDDFENASAVQLNNVMYFTNGYDQVQKYDGQNMYRAGLPTPAVPTSVLAAGAVTGSNYFHKIQYVQVDAVGNVVEGNQSTVATGLSPAGQSMNVTVANIQASTGFNTNCAIVNGGQVGVTTITVDDGSGGGHTMKVGDTAYFKDQISGSYVERAITAITATTITIAGTAVNVNDNQVISNNLRILIFRNKTSSGTPTTFYEVEEIPNNSFAATQVFNDNKADASLGAIFVSPLTDRSAPPKGKYISAWRKSLFIAGSYTDPFTCFYSDVDGPEYFPADGSTSFDIYSLLGDPISGIGPNNDVFAIFTKRSVDIASGDIVEGNIRVDQISTDIGCVAHATIQELRGTLAFLSDRGPYKMVAGQIPTPLGESEYGGGRIEPIFDQDGLGDAQVFKLKRAVGFNDRKREQYKLFLPCESASGNKYANDNSRMYVYDYAKDAWLEWTNINAAGGMTATGEDFYWVERRLSPEFSSVTSYLYRVRNLNDAFDYADHNQAIDWEYGMQWEALGEPSVMKSFVRAKIFSLEETNNNTNDVSVEVEFNYVSDTPILMFDFSFPSGGYGVSEYSTASYGDPAENVSIHKLGGSRTKSARLIFKNNTINQNAIISGWELEIATSYRPRLKV